ncbi:DEAD/DEAH box helicase, partial [Bacillus sp. D-CC]
MPLNSLEKQRHIEFKHVDLRGDEWADLGERRRRKSRKKPNDELDVMATKVIKKPKKVKPNY